MRRDIATLRLRGMDIDELRMFRMDRISNPRQLRRSFVPSRAVFESALPA
ncbi:MAG: hypothetical protein CL908_13980 [Deltaproteobacteria bacterium]|nr:hypothetical protein [Deltaproteobacteria bacterium]